MVTKAQTYKIVQTFSRSFLGQIHPSTMTTHSINRIETRAFFFVHHTPRSLWSLPWNKAIIDNDSNNTQVNPKNKLWCYPRKADLPEDILKPTIDEVKSMDKELGIEEA